MTEVLQEHAKVWQWLKSANMMHRAARWWRAVLVVHVHLYTAMCMSCECAPCMLQYRLVYVLEALMEVSEIIFLALDQKRNLVLKNFLLLLSHVLIFRLVPLGVHNSQQNISCAV